MLGELVTNINSKHLHRSTPPFIPFTKREHCIAEQYISSLTQNLAPGYLESTNKLDFRGCREEILFLIHRKRDLHAAPKAQLLSCLFMDFQRQTNLALQSNTALAEKINVLKEQNVSLSHKVQTADKKDMLHLEDLHSAESNLFSSKEELFKLRHERPMPSLSSSSSQFLSQANTLVEHPFSPPHGDVIRGSNWLLLLWSSAGSSQGHPDYSHSSECSTRSSSVWSLQHMEERSNVPLCHFGHKTGIENCPSSAASCPCQDIREEWFTFSGSGETLMTRTINQSASFLLIEQNEFPVLVLPSNSRKNCLLFIPPKGGLEISHLYPHFSSIFSFGPSAKEQSLSSTWNTKLSLIFL